MKTLYSLLATITFLYAHPQSTAETAIKAGELILGGFSILKSNKVKKDNDASFITSICVKNYGPKIEIHTHTNYKKVEKVQ